MRSERRGEPMVHMRLGIAVTPYVNSHTSTAKVDKNVAKFLKRRRPTQTHSNGCMSANNIPIFHRPLFLSNYVQTYAKCRQGAISPPKPTFKPHHVCTPRPEFLRAFRRRVGRHVSLGNRQGRHLNRIDLRREGRKVEECDRAIYLSRRQ